MCITAGHYKQTWISVCTCLHAPARFIIIPVINTAFLSHDICHFVEQQLIGVVNISLPLFFLLNLLQAQDHMGILLWRRCIDSSPMTHGLQLKQENRGKTNTTSLPKNSNLAAGAGGGALLEHITQQCS